MQILFQKVAVFVNAGNAKDAVIGLELTDKAFRPAAEDAAVPPGA